MRSRLLDTGATAFFLMNDGNLLVLATDTEGDAVEDRVVKVDVTTGEVMQVLDMGDLLPDFKAEYDAERNLIASYTMDVEKFIYRVYKYSFDGYYFE